MSNELPDESQAPEVVTDGGTEAAAAADAAAPKKAPRKSTKKTAKKKPAGTPVDASQDPAESAAESPAPGEPAPATAEAQTGSQDDPAAENAESAAADPAEVVEEKAPEKVLPPVPEAVDLNELHTRPLAALHRLAVEAELRVAGIRSKHQLLFELVSYYGRRGTQITAEGILEQEGNGYGFLRWPRFSFQPLPDDVYVSPSVIRRKNLLPGTRMKCTVRVPKDKEKFFAVDQILTIEGVPEEQWETPKHFDKLTALFPKERIILEVKDNASITSRVIDLVAPLGKGQRGLIVAPPRGGKTLILKDIARSIKLNYPHVELIVLLLDERPEEVTDFKETVENVEVFSSTFDEPPKRHIQVAERVLDRARRLVELKKDVVILLDSLTRLGRGYNLFCGGNTTSGGMKTKALERVRRFFGAARNVEEGGSLTLLASALIETESRMDDVIFEEFKGTGNMEIQLDRELVEKRVFPAIQLRKSGTRNDEKLYHPEEFKRITMLRRELAQMPAVEAMEVLIRNIHLTRSNAELLLKGLK